MREFQLLIKPVGDRCNLQCRYCFYTGTDDLLAKHLDPERRPAETMPDDILEKMIEELLAYRLKQSIFCWQGGEPTLAGLDFFRRVVELQMKHGARGQVVGNAFQTNGLLIDRDWAKLLAEYRFLVGLSIDGPRPVHETYRGRSFEPAMRAAQLFQQFGVAFNLLCVVSQANVHRGAETYRWFVDHAHQHIQFIPCRELEKDGNLTPESITGEEFGDFLCEVFDLWAKRDVGKVFERTFDSLLTTYVGGRPTVCTFSARCSDYLLIERGGEVFPCDFYGQPEWLLGYLGERPMAEYLLQARRERFESLKGDAAPACRRCEYGPLCHGGCPRDRTPDGLNHYCDGYRKFFAFAGPRLEAIAAEIRRSRGAQGGQTGNDQ